MIGYMYIMCKLKESCMPPKMSFNDSNNYNNSVFNKLFRSDRFLVYVWFFQLLLSLAVAIN